MEPDQALCFTPVSHPDPRVQRVGFDLTDPYVEQCWSAVVGPTSVLLLRRLPTMWMARVPVEMGASELSLTLGLRRGVGKHCRLASVLARVARYGLAEPARGRGIAAGRDSGGR